MTQDKESEIDFWDMFNVEQKKELGALLQESEDESNLVRNEVVMEKARQWLKK